MNKFESILFDYGRCGYLGDVAINNLSAYMVEALTRAGYSNS